MNRSGFSGEEQEKYLKPICVPSERIDPRLSVGTKMTFADGHSKHWSAASLGTDHRWRTIEYKR